MADGGGETAGQPAQAQRQDAHGQGGRAGRREGVDGDDEAGRDHRARGAVGAEHDDRGEPEQAVQRGEGVRVERGVAEHQQGAAQPGHGGGDGEGQQLEVAHVHAHRSRALRVVTHGQQRPAETSFVQVAHDEQAEPQTEQLHHVEPAVGQRVPGDGQRRDVQSRDERLLLEDEAGHHRPDRERGEGERQPAPPDGGVPGEQAHRGDQQRADQRGGKGRQRGQPEQVAVGELGGQQRAESGVAGDAKGDLPAVTGDDHQGQEDQGERRHDERVAQVDGREGERGRQQHGAGEFAEDVPALLGEARPVRLRRAAAGEPAGGARVPTELAQPGEDQQQHQQRGHEQVGLHGQIQGAELARHLELAQLALQDADGQGGEHRARQAGQPGGHDHRERLQYQQGEPVRGELQAGREQDAGEACEGGADGPAGRGHPVGRDGGQLGEPAVVDDGPDLPAETGTGRDQAEGHAHGDDQSQLGERVDTDAAAPGQPDRLLREQARRVVTGPQTPDPGCHPDGEHEHAKARHQRLGRGRAPAGQRAEDEPFEHDADQR